MVKESTRKVVELINCGTNMYNDGRITRHEYLYFLDCVEGALLAVDEDTEA